MSPSLRILADVRRLAMHGATALLGLALATACDDATTHPDAGARRHLAGAAARAGAAYALDDPIALTLAAPTVLVVPGGSGEVGVRVTRGDSAGVRVGRPVALSADGLPDGVRAAFRPATVGDTVDASTVTVDVAESVAPGTHDITLTARADSATASTTRLTLVVVSAPTFAMTLDHAAVRLESGGSAAVAVRLHRAAGYANSVALSVTGAPKGVTARLSSDTVAGDGAALTVAADSTAPVGTVSVLVRAVAADSQEQVAALRVTVAPPAGDDYLATWAACDTLFRPLWVAYRDGAGPWRRLVPTDGRYAFRMRAPEGGLAIVTGSETRGYVITVNYGTFETLTPACAAAPPTPAPRDPLVRVTGTALGLDGGTKALITLGSARADARPPEAGPADGPRAFVFDSVREASTLLAALRVPDGAGSTIVPDRMILRRDVDLRASTTLAPLDFASAEAFAPLTPRLTLRGLGKDRANVSVGVVTGAGTRFDLVTLFADTVSGARAAGTYRALPPSRRASGDLYFVSVFATADNGGDTDDEDDAPVFRIPSIRAVSQAFRNPGDVTIDLGDLLTPPTVSVVARTPYVRYRARWRDTGGYSFTTAAFNPLGFGSTSVVLTRRVQSGAGADVELELPDFTGVDGWNEAWGPRAGIPTLWSFTANEADVAASAGQGNTLAGWRTRFISVGGQLQP